MNDWSARDIQGKEMKLKLGPSKGKDFATTIGPWVVTADELDDCRDADGFLDLEMTVKVNGERVGADRSGHMGWSFEQLVSHASRASWVKAGEVLASGTCSSGSLAESWGRTGLADPAAAAGRRRRRDDHRAARHDPQPRRRRPEDRARRRPGPAPRPREGSDDRRRRHPQPRHRRGARDRTPPTTRPASSRRSPTTHAACAVWARDPARGAAGAAARGRQAADRAARGVRRADHRRDGQAARRGARRGRQVRVELRGRRRPRARLAGRPRGRVRRRRGPGCRTSRSASCSR